MTLPRSSTPFWRAALRIAWRDLQSSPRRAIAATLAVAAGVAAVGAVHALASGMRAKVTGDAREWIAADLYLNLNEQPSEEAISALAPLLQKGAQTSLVTELYGMVSSANSPDPALTFLKVVDPTRYPFYGIVELRPSLPLLQALSGDSVVVSNSLLEELRLHPGDTIRLGKGRFRVAAAIAVEPDWSAGLSTALPRVLLSNQNFQRSSVALQGDVEYKLLVQLGHASLPEARQLLEKTFPADSVVDYRDPDPSAAAAFDQAAAYLTLVAWLALGLGAVAEALVLHLHIQRRLDTVAVMKALGGRSGQILAIYGLQAMAIALAGGLVGAVAAQPLQWALAALVSSLFPVNLASGWNWLFAAEAMATGLLAGVSAAALPVLRLRRVSSLGVLRRHAASGLPRRFALPRFLPLPLRLGARNLFRPGNHTVAMVVMLSAGVAMLTATRLCEQRISLQVARAVPAQGANLYLVSTGRPQLDAAAQWLAGQPGVVGVPTVFPLVDLRLDRINGVALTPPGNWLATCSDGAAVDEIRVPSDHSLLHASAGDLMEFSFKGRTLRGRVAAQSLDYLDGFVSALTFPCSAFAGLDLFYHAAVRVNPSDESALRRSLAARYPGLPSISRAEFTNMVRRISDAALVMVQVVSWTVLAVGVLLQILLLAAGKDLRLSEAAVAKALGARPRSITQTYACEFGLVGLCAGLAGTILGALLASVLLSVLLHQVMVAFDSWMAALQIAFMALLAAGSGAIANRGILRRRTLEILRQE